MKINVRPLSVNQCWRGHRFKTPKYKAYEKELLLRLRPLKLPQAPYKITLEFGFSTVAADWDNPIKPFVDILQKKYGFDDREIYEATVKKTVVKKGEEYIKFRIISLVC